MFIRVLKALFVLPLAPMVLLGCVGTPDGVRPVQGFELDRYLGTWYEIARLDHSFERGLSNVTANYSLREDGGVRVINRGFDTAKGEWDEAEGRAYFVEEDDKGFLKVSFFGPFYGSYIVFELNSEDYSYAFISGPDTSFLWLLARTPEVPEAVRQRFVERATDGGHRSFESHRQKDHPLLRVLSRHGHRVARRIDHLDAGPFGPRLFQAHGARRHPHEIAERADHGVGQSGQSQGAIEIGDKVYLNVPSGNFGNALGGYYAMRMGLPVEKILISSNSNNVLTELIQTGSYDLRDRDVIATSSPAATVVPITTMYVPVPTMYLRRGLFGRWYVTYQ